MAHIPSLGISSLALAGALFASDVASAPSLTAVKCRSDAFVAYLDPGGRVTLLEYLVGRRAVAPTGRQLASVTASSAALAPCPRTRPHRPPTRAAVLAGPYPWSKSLLRIYCGTSATLALVSARSIEIDVRPLVDAQRRRSGSRLTVRIDSHPVFDADVKRNSRHYAIDWSRCKRNPSF